MPDEQKQHSKADFETVRTALRNYGTWRQQQSVRSDATLALRRIEEQLEASQKAFRYVDACFERDGEDEPITRALRTALRVAEAWEVKNEDARYVAALIRDALPPLADASGVVRAALANGSNPASDPDAQKGGTDA